MQIRIQILKQINKIDAFILCKNYSTLATLSNLISKKIIRKEDIKEGEDITKFIKIVTQTREIFHNIYLYEGYYYIDYDILLLNDLSKVECKINRYYIYGKGIEIYYLNEFYNIKYMEDAFIFKGFELKETEAQEIYKKEYNYIYRNSMQ